jgi:integrase
MHLGYEGRRRLRKSFYGRTRREVQEQLTRALRDMHQGLHVATDERQTVEQYLRRWLADAVRPAVRPSTLTAYEMHVRLHLIPEIGRIPLARLTPQHVQAMLNAKLRSGLAPRSVLHIRAVLRRALNQALRWGLVTRNVATLVDPPRAPRYEVQAMTPEQARALLNAVRGDRLEALYTIALALGLRQGEALGLQWDDLDLDAGTVTVRHALQRISGRLQLVEPKTDRSSRTIPMPTAVVTSLRAHRTRQLEERLWAGSRWHEGTYVFTTTIGTPLDGSNVTHRLQRIMATGGLPRQRFHDLRHACASLMLTLGVPPRVVMETLGHSQISLTMNTYSHVIPSLQRDAADRMEELLAP